MQSQELWLYHRDVERLFSIFTPVVRRGETSARGKTKHGRIEYTHYDKRRIINGKIGDFILQKIKISGKDLDSVKKDIGEAYAEHMATYDHYTKESIPQPLRIPNDYVQEFMRTFGRTRKGDRVGSDQVYLASTIVLLLTRFTGPLPYVGLQTLASEPGTIPDSMPDPKVFRSVMRRLRKHGYIGVDKKRHSPLWYATEKGANLYTTREITLLREPITVIALPEIKVSR